MRYFNTVLDGFDLEIRGVGEFFNQIILDREKKTYFIVKLTRT